jgi:hypothetical protein
MTPVRRGGRLDGPSGQHWIWSIAEGTRGTRWREVATDGGGVTRSILLEVTQAGRPQRLEVATRAGLLTLHPEVDGSALHGNVVTPDGIRHLTFPWTDENVLLVMASPVAAAVIVRSLPPMEVGATTGLDVVRLDDLLEPDVDRVTVTRSARDAWSIQPTSGGPSSDVRLDTGGLPTGSSASDWPLE